MNICIPVRSDNGLASAVSNHFGSAPFFMMVDTETLAYKSIQNQNLHHAHGMCHPVAALAGEKVDGVVVGGIGMGALNKLSAAGYSVFQSAYATVHETINAFKNGKLLTVSERDVCGGHGHIHGHGRDCR